MPGIATHFKILDLTIAKLSTGNAQQKQIANVMTSNKPWAYLGAVGPALADFIPAAPPQTSITSSPANTAGNFYAALWKDVFAIVGGNGTATDPGLLSIIQTFQNFFSQIQPIITAQNIGGLEAMKNSGEIAAVSTAAANLKTLIQTLTTTSGGFLSTLESVIGQGLAPVINNPTNESPEVWTAREYLFWLHTGDFTKALLESAEASGNQTFLAYAYGYVSGYAGFVAGSSFVNSVIGGTYRSDWWRYRWIDNFIDSWVYGYYNARATMTGDTPNPAYANWPGLCNASLHNTIALPGLDTTNPINNLTNGVEVISSDFNAFWFGAFESVFGPRPANTRFPNGSLNAAYIMTYLVLWFQTSGTLVGCNPPPPAAPPPGASPQPSWVDPTNPGSNGAGSVPPNPTVQRDPNIGEIVCGAILALLGLASLATGGLISGGAEIAGGVDLIIAGASQINWTKLASDVYWYSQYFYVGLKQLHEALVLGGLQPPYTSVLQSGDATTLLGVQFTYQSAIANCKSTSSSPNEVIRNALVFPPIPWGGNVFLDGLWINRPDRDVEAPATIAYETGNMYPNFFIDDNTNNPLSKGRISVGTPVATAADGGHLVNNPAIATAVIPIQFGNVVANTLDLYSSDNFPNWNLDSDRGLAYLTWGMKGGWTNPMVIQPS
jgi:hypothetical protein